MSHKFWVILLVVLLISGPTVRVFGEDETGEIAVEDKWTTILDIEDPIGDDYGPGTYLYPTHVQFAPYQGLLDIERFKVEGTEKLIRFQITFGQITNPWHGPFGFSHQLIQIYIDHRPGGKRRPFYPGAKVVFSPRAPWDTLIKVTGWGMYIFRCTDKPEKEPAHYTKGDIKVLADGKTIQVQIPIEDISSFDDLYDASYYLLVGGQDGFGPDNYRVVKKEVSEWYFGGGDGSGYAPNVIDILTLPHKSQQKILGSYDPTNRVLAVVEPVHRPNPLKKGIIYLISITVGILLWYSWCKRDEFNLDQ
ncbi:hypothetical protein BBF96_01815 [Anoxybacter fermentans]|uniref:Glucodextranase-like C-terminal domain-containing protein n=1 Tax=Anoxybacter fermentans TaxID=1323375 RepID=A0A3Q9HNZ6_9FIRM|nr:glucodextranase DOMON-like domain-containing protein [Anoxybacter fermentans]AZR72243.1 hypothetical protein BBF96_01815 [Anoxybacter fermentans]